VNPLTRAFREYPLTALQDRRRELESRGVEVFDFGTGDPREPTPAFIREAALDAIPEVSQYPSVMGSRTLRNAIASYLGRRFGVIADPGTQIIASAGSKEAIFHAPLVLLDADSRRRRVLFGTPGYPVYEWGAAHAGAIPHALVLDAADGFLPRLDRLPASILDEAALAWICTPHNPTGAVASRAWLEDTLALCRAHDVLLCSDECYADIYPPGGTPPPSALEVAGPEFSGVLAFHSTSKRSGMTGYRSGFVAGDCRLLGLYKRQRGAFGVGSADFVQSAAAAAWADDVHAAQRRTIFEDKRAIVATWLDERRLPCAAAGATFYLWVRVPNGHTSASYCELLLEHTGILASPGPAFGDGGEGYFRLALVPTVEGCRAAVARWRDSGV